MSQRPKIRLFVEHPLGAGQCVPLTQPQAHYLFSVMRLGKGRELALFNGHDGEWRAQVIEAGRRDGVVECLVQTLPLQMPPDLWLLFAPIKKARTDFIVEKATELGARRILPVHTDFTNAERLRADRLRAHAIEAAEQCGGTFVPELAELAPLEKVLANWDPERHLFWCDESLAAAASPPLATPISRGTPGAVLIGPEGGFSQEESAQLRAQSFVQPLALGPRILRADTAAVAALSLWQHHLGDWV